MKVILGMWLPQSHDGPNPKPGVWQVNYTERRAEYVAKIQAFLDQYDSHPALLMWCLGNEVNISQSFLETLNAMSETIHAHNPDRVSCYVGKGDTDVALFAEYATDIDLYGQNSYGYNKLSRKAQEVVQHWKKKFFISEYAWKGPWTASTTASGYTMEFTPAVKVSQLITAFNVLSEHDKLVGGVFFLWAPISMANITKTSS